MKDDSSFWVFAAPRIWEAEVMWFSVSAYVRRGRPQGRAWCIEQKESCCLLWFVNPIQTKSDEA